MSQMIPLNLVLASILDTFGISVTSILLHLLNLVVLTVGLYFLLFKPVKRMVRERQEKVKKIEQENSELNAEVKKLKDNTEEVLTEAKKEAADIHEKAVRVANQKADDIIGEAKIKAKGLVERTERNWTKSAKNCSRISKRKLPTYPLWSRKKYLRATSPKRITSA